MMIDVIQVSSVDKRLKSSPMNRAVGIAIVANRAVSIVYIYIYIYINVDEEATILKRSSLQTEKRKRKRGRET